MGGRVLRLVGGVAMAALFARAAAAQPAPSALPARDASAAVGDLLVAPTRIVLEGNQRSAEVTLVNIGDQPGTYRISLTHLRMTEDGKLVEIESPGQEDHTAEQLVRFSPRQVTLEPDVAQTVRIQLRKPADLAAGEYRSHILFRAIPRAETAAGNVEANEASPASGLSIRLIPIYGVSIPLIVRHGTTDADAAISGVRLDRVEGRPESVWFNLERTGNRSVYGNLKVAFVPNGGQEVVVGMLNGVAVYTPLERRIVQIPLQAPEGVSLSKGTLRVSFTGEGVDEGTVANGEIALP